LDKTLSSIHPEFTTHKVPQSAGNNAGSSTLFFTLVDRDTCEVVEFFNVSGIGQLQ